MLLAKNKKALFNNEVVEKYMAGIELRGYEVKALREKNVSFEGSYVIIDGGNAYVKNLYIGRYSNQSQEHNTDDARRTRRLLLTSREIQELSREISEKGKTAVPLALVLRNNLIKLEFAVVKGRKKHEKKTVLKKRQLEKDLQKAKKSGNIWL